MVSLRAYMSKATWLLRGGSPGVTLLELVVSTTLLGFAGVAVVGGVAAGLRGTDSSTVRSVAGLLARSELDYVASQPFNDSGGYLIVPNLPPGFEVLVQVTTLQPGVLQEVTALAGRTGESPVAVSAYKTNRLLEIGARPQSAGLEGSRRLTFPYLLNAGEGVFQVVEIAPTEYRGVFRARWRLVATPPVGLPAEARSLSLTMFDGTPLGPGPLGISTIPPEQVVGAPRVSAATADLVIEVLASQVPGGLYTLYFFNRDPQVALTAEAVVECICPK